MMMMKEMGEMKCLFLHQTPIHLVYFTLFWSVVRQQDVVERMYLSKVVHQTKYWVGKVSVTDEVQNHLTE